MKKYNSPEMSVVVSSQEDIMDFSDTFVDVGNLWGSTSSSETTEG